MEHYRDRDAHRGLHAGRSPHRHAGAVGERLDRFHPDGAAHRADVRKSHCGATPGRERWRDDSIDWNRATAGRVTCVRDWRLIVSLPSDKQYTRMISRLQDVMASASTNIPRFRYESKVAKTLSVRPSNELQRHVA